ncbi:YwbE family protein [Planococcaceae bacterium Storch 2/2-2]|nr:YwbE family protein [Planococcaceae bacterium Storch 2/2-2]
MNGKMRKDVRIGQTVRVVQKPHQRTGQLTEGVVARILTNSATHPHGIKVKLESGIVGRIQQIIES